MSEDAKRWALAEADAVADPSRLPYTVRDAEGDRRADFWIRGDGERYVRDENRRRESGFVLSIGLGNAAMSSAEDVRDALAGIGQCIDDGERDGNVFDENGQVVGHWSLELPPPPASFYKARDLQAGQRVKVGDTFERIEAVGAMPGGRVEVITEPYSEGVLWEGGQLCEVLDEEAV